MKRYLNLLLALFLCVPILLFTGCGTKMCKTIDTSYYFNNKINCSFFYDRNTRDLSIFDLEAKNPDKDLLDAYAQIMINTNSENARAYHLYIDYITFYVYFNESSEFDFNLKVLIPNAVEEKNVWENTENLDDIDKNFQDTYSTKPKANKSAEFKIKVQRVIVVTTGTSITFDLTENNEIFKPQEDMEEDEKAVTFKWLIYGLEIHAEARAY